VHAEARDRCEKGFDHGTATEEGVGVEERPENRRILLVAAGRSASILPRESIAMQE